MLCDLTLPTSFWFYICDLKIYILCPPSIFGFYIKILCYYFADRNPAIPIKLFFKFTKSNKFGESSLLNSIGKRKNHFTIVLALSIPFMSIAI